MADFKRVKFTVDAVDYDLGYYEWITESYNGNTQTRIVPRAIGVKLWDTEELGGGELTIRVDVFITSTSRLHLEQQINTLITNIGGKTGTLTIDDTLVFTNCAMQSLIPSGDVLKDSYFTINFIKSM